MRPNYLCVILMTLVLVWAFPAQADEAAFAGFWDGSIALPGTSLGIRVHLERNDAGDWSGTIDIPMQGAKDLPLADISVASDSITFAIADVPGTPTFNGVRDGDSIEGPFSQGGQRFNFELTRGTDMAPKRPQDPVPPFPYSSEDVSFNNGDVTLAGTLTVPEGEGPFPAVVLLTGSGPQNRDEAIFDHRPFLVIADHLSRRGIAVLRYDDRGVGESTGNITEATSADFAEDALAAVALIGNDARIDAERIGLLGHSEGAMVAPMAAATSDAVAFLVLLAAPGVPTPDLLATQVASVARAQGSDEETVQQIVQLNRELTGILTTYVTERAARADIRDIIIRQFELAPPEERPTGDVLENILRSNIDNLLTPWFRFFIRYDPRVALREVTVPVLALCGSLDTQVIDTQNLPALEVALAEAGNADVTARSMPGLNHMFQHATTGGIAEYGEIDETISPEVLEIISDWIAARFMGED